MVIMSSGLRAQTIAEPNLIVSSAFGTVEPAEAPIAAVAATATPASQQSIHVRADPLTGTSGKSPIVAGLLSWVLPGLGSFYAGNSRHGVIHLAVDVGAYGLLFSSCGDLSCNGGMIGGSALVLVGNEIWSIFTAVADANAANGPASKSGRVVGSLYVRPEVHALGVHQAKTTQNIGVQALSWSF
jgi:hypothetical protein